MSSSPPDFRSLYTIRPGTREDLPFIIDSWVETYRASKRAQWILQQTYNLEPYARALEPDHERPSVYRALQRRLVELHLAEAEVRVASMAEDSNVILGWACFGTSPDRLFYVCVKKDYKRQGIGTELVGSCGFTGEIEVLYNTPEFRKFWTGLHG